MMPSGHTGRNNIGPPSFFCRVTENSRQQATALRAQSVMPFVRPGLGGAARGPTDCVSFRCRGRVDLDELVRPFAIFAESEGE